MMFGMGDITPPSSIDVFGAGNVMQGLPPQTIGLTDLQNLPTTNQFENVSVLDTSVPTPAAPGSTLPAQLQVPPVPSGSSTSTPGTFMGMSTNTLFLIAGAVAFLVVFSLPPSSGRRRR